MSAPLRILVVDDDLLVKRTVAAALADVCAAQVWEARTGQEGLSLAALHRPDLILLDLDLPDMDGLAVCEALRGDEQPAAIWILTGLAADQDLIRAATRLADRVIQKPISLAELSQAILERIVPHGPPLSWVGE